MNIGAFTKDERPKKEPDERLTPSMEGTLSEEPTVLGTNLHNELDQKADGKNDKNLGTTEVGKSSLISQLIKKVAEKWQSDREEEASTVPNHVKTTKPKGKIFLRLGRGWDSHQEWVGVFMGNFEKNPL